MKMLALGLLLITPLAHARECSAPPVRNSEQAMCYATAYADKNGISHGSSFSRKVSKGRSSWNVHFEDKRPDTRGAGWEVDVDPASGTVTRFKSYKGDTKGR